MPFVRSRRGFLIAPLVALVATTGACSADDDPPAVDVGSDAVGKCLDFEDFEGEEVATLPEVPCDTPHSHEIFAVEQVGGDTYPGFEELEAEAMALCFGAFEDYVEINPVDSDFFISWLVPTLTSWDRDDDREVICVAGERGGALLDESIRGAGR